MRPVRALTGLLVCAALAPATLTADGDRLLKVSTQRGLPPIESVTVYQTKNGKREVVGKPLTNLEKAISLPNDGPFEVWARPKNGIAVRVADKLTVKSGTHELKLGDVLGVVEVFGDNFPRADKVVITDTRDPGPGEKGHVAIQVATDYRVDMAVPPGTYAVWVVPANGAKAQRVEDNIRVLAGRSVKVGG